MALPPRKWSVFVNQSVVCYGANVCFFSKSIRTDGVWYCWSHIIDDDECFLCSSYHLLPTQTAGYHDAHLRRGYVNQLKHLSHIYSRWARQLFACVPLGSVPSCGKMGKWIWMWDKRECGLSVTEVSDRGICSSRCRTRGRGGVENGTTRCHKWCGAIWKIGIRSRGHSDVIGDKRMELERRVNNVAAQEYNIMWCVWEAVTYGVRQHWINHSVGLTDGVY